MRKLPITAGSKIVAGAGISRLRLIAAPACVREG
jgi:hypothetical protein